MSRLTLDAKLKAIADELGCSLYFQPPADIRLTYPCILYSASGSQDMRANNGHYVLHIGYDITYITKDPDTKVPFKILETVSYGNLGRQFVSDNLYHHVIECYEIY